MRLYGTARHTILGTWLLFTVVMTALTLRAEEEIVIKDRPLSYWLEKIQDSNRGFQMRAARALTEATINQIPLIVPHLIPLLEASRENSRFPAAQVLGEYGSPARAAVPLLVAMLKGTEYERNRAAAAKALGQILENAEPCDEVDKVAEALSAKYNKEYDTYSDVRREAVRSVGMIGPAAKRVIPKLTRGLTDYRQYSREHQMVRQQAAWTCGRMGPLAAEHMDRLISMMHSEGHEVPEIVEAIGKIGPINKNVIPNIIDKFESSGHGGSWGEFKVAALGAFARFGPKSAEALPMLKRWFGQLGADRTSFALRTSMMKTLAAIGPAAKGWAPTIESQLRFSNNSDWRIPKKEKAELHERLHSAAAAAWKTVMGTDPPAEKKKAK